MEDKLNIEKIKISNTDFLFICFLKFKANLAFEIN